MTGRRKIGNRLLIGVVLLGLVFMAGCGTLEKLVNKDPDQASFGDFIGFGENQTADVPAVANMAASGETRTIELYFADATGKYLVREQRTVPKTESLARETVVQWLKGPAGTEQGSLALVPTTTQLLDIALKDGVATVDVSKEFLQPNQNVTQEVALYGLVNSLTQYSSIQRVQLRVEGNPLTKYGTLDATMLVSKENLLKDAATGNPILPSTGSDSGAASSGGSGSGSNSSSGGGTLPASPSSINIFEDNAGST